MGSLRGVEARGRGGEGSEERSHLYHLPDGRRRPVVVLVEHAKLLLWRGCVRVNRARRRG